MAMHLLRKAKSASYLMRRCISDYNEASATSSSSGLPTMVEVRQELMNLIGYDAAWGDAPPIDKVALTEMTKKSQDELSKEPMRADYAEAIIPLADKPLLRNRYANFMKFIRFGRLLEDLDTMAVHLAYRHNHTQNVTINGRTISPIVIVTGLVDRISVNPNLIHIDKNIKLSGFTSWVGRTSSEVTMKLQQDVNGEWVDILDTKFIVCARDALNKGSAVMNPLALITDEDKQIFEQGEVNRQKRHLEEKESLLKVAPNNVESQHIHEMFLKTIDLESGTFKQRIKPHNMVWMSDTNLKNVMICFPEQRNLYNKVFGGFIMRQAFELAWMNACLYSKSSPRIRIVDDITFKKPVLIGNLLMLSSDVVYTEGNSMQVRVHASSVDPKTGIKEHTNDFYFRFNVMGTVNLPQVLPRTYAESIMYLDGKRHMF